MTGAIRVLIAKPGLDGHDRGAKVVARFLKEAEMIVTYTGIRQTPRMIAEAALAANVDVIGLSILSGSHLELFPKIIAELEEKGIDPSEVLIIAGGIIPDADIASLRDIGVRKVFGPGSSMSEITECIEDWIEKKEQLKRVSD